MRILTGKLKGRVIKMPKGIRPTQNKVRKALFDILGDIEGLTFLELFAGSASVGLESISRGIKELVIVESSRECQKAISKNIDKLKVQTCTFLPYETEKAIKLLDKEKRCFDIIFLDPPYYDDAAKKNLQLLGACDILAPNGLVIAQHFKKDVVPEIAGNLIRFKQYFYGGTVLSFYRKN